MPKSKVINIRKPPRDMEQLLGAAGIHIFSGFFNLSDADEYVQELKGQKALATYNRMRRSDAQVRLSLLALTHPIVNAKWMVVPPGNPETKDNPTPQEVECAKFINEIWFSDEMQWEKLLRQILSMFWAGFSVFEKSYKYDGSFIVPKKIAQRMQTTIVEWDIQDEELIQIKQYITAGKTARQVWIPSEKLLYFVFDQEGDDYRGQSVLRSAYKHWFYKDIYHRLQAIQYERFGTGMPVIKQIDAVVNTDSKSAAIEMAKNIRAHEKGFAYIPKGFELELLDSQGKTLDMMPGINHHDAALLKAVMAQFLQLGVEDTGSRAVGETLKDFYMMGLSFAANYICEVIRKDCFKELTEWNFGPNVRPPKLVPQGIQPIDFDLIANGWGTLVSSGAVTKDEQIEAHVRKLIGAPQRTEEDIQAEKDEAQNEKDQQAELDSEASKQLKSKPGKKLYIPQPYSPNGQEADTFIHFWRPLSPAEQNVALREIAGHLDDSKERMVRATKEIRTEVVKILVNQVSAIASNKEPMFIQKIDYSDTEAKRLKEKVMPVLNELVAYGRQQVSRELSKTLTAAFPGKTKAEAIKAMQDYLEARADHFTEISLDKLVDEARIQAANAVRTGSFNAADVTEALDEFSENAVRRSAGYVVNEAFGFGRDAEATDRADEIDHAEYSAILDNGTCYPCEQLDGNEYEVGSAEYEAVSPPNENICEGGLQCRCIWVYVGIENKGG